jgi:hypothetical protein
MATPYMPSLAEMARGAGALHQMDEIRRQNQVRSRLGELLSNPNADIGSPTTLREIMAIDPETGMGFQKTLADLAKTQAETGYKQAQTAKAGMDAASTKQNFVIEGAKRLRGYLDTLPPEQHQAALEQLYPQFVQSLGQTGAFSPEELQDMAAKGPDLKAFYSITGGGMDYDIQKARRTEEARLPYDLERKRAEAELSASRPITPYQRESLDLRRQRIAQMGGGQSKPPSGYRWGANGNLEPIPGGPADKPTLKAPGHMITKELTGQLDKLDTLRRLNQSFADEFAGNPALGRVENWMGRTFGDPASPGQAQWWQDYQGYINDVRHSLFGGALTQTEKAEFEKAIISPGMNPKQARQNLARQQQIVESALNRRLQIYGRQGFDMSPFQDGLPQSPQGGGATGSWGGGGSSPSVSAPPSSQQYDMSDIEFTAQQYGMTPEQVIQMLEGQ